MVKSSTKRILDHLQARHAKKKKDRTTESLKWQSHGVKMNIGALPRRCRPFSRTESGPLKSQEQYKTQRRSASALFPIAHEKPVFVVGSWSLGPRHVLEINERNCGSENKKDLGEDTSRGEITKGGRSGGIVVGG